MCPVLTQSASQTREIQPTAMTPGRATTPGRAPRPRRRDESVTAVAIASALPVLPLPARARQRGSGLYSDAVGAALDPGGGMTMSVVSMDERPCAGASPALGTETRERSRSTAFALAGLGGNNAHGAGF